MKKLIGAFAALALTPVMLLLGVVLLFTGGSTSVASSGCATATITSGPGPPEIPTNLYPIYVAADQIYGVPWQYLAAINKVESDFGRSTLPGVHSGTNYAGAAGPMQFELSTWAKYGVDGNNDGVKDIYDPQDAIFGAANYLKASGAPNDMYHAIFAYNHLDSYVREVAGLATQYVREAGNQPAINTPDTSCSVGTPPAASPQKIQLFVQAALTQLGTDYVWGGDCRGNSGCDCSGLVWWAAQQAGFHFTRTTAAGEYNLGPHVDWAHLQYGDLLFWGDGTSDVSKIHHVAIYLGPDKNGVIQMIAAPHTGTVVKIEPVYQDGYFGATRLAG